MSDVGLFNEVNHIYLVKWIKNIIKNVDISMKGVRTWQVQISELIWVQPVSLYM